MQPAKRREGSRGARAEGRGSGPQPLKMLEQGWEEGGESPGTREPGAGEPWSQGRGSQGHRGERRRWASKSTFKPNWPLDATSALRTLPRGQPLNPPLPQASSRPLRWPLLGAQGSCQPQGQPRAPLTRPWVPERLRFKGSITSGRSDALPLIAVICVQGVTPRALLSPWC